MLWFISALGTAVCFGVNNTLFKWGALQHLSKVCIQLFFYWISFFILLLFTLIKGSFEFHILPILTGGTNRYIKCQWQYPNVESL